MLSRAHSRRGYRVYVDDDGWNVALYFPSLPREQAQHLTTHSTSEEAFAELRVRVARWEEALRMARMRMTEKEV